MRHRRTRSIVVALALPLAFAVSLAARGEQQEDVTQSLRSLTATLQKVQAAALQVQKSQPSALEALGIHGFSVALVLGDMQGASTTDNVPGGAKKALADMRDFLPYKSYKLIDAQWILCCGGTSVPVTSVSGRLRGASMPGAMEEQEYAFTVSVIGTAGSKLSIRFSLRDGTAGKGNAPKEGFSKYAEESTTYTYIMQLEENRTAHQAVEAEIAQLRASGFGANHPKVKEAEARAAQLKQRGEEIERAAAARRRAETTVPGSSGKAIIDSTFSMEVGETVVIGTSSLKGDKALIALLTAAQRPARVSKTEGR